MGAQDDVVTFLSDPKSYGAAEPVEVHETHGSFVFLTGTRAYKLKRAVHYYYMDYSTPQRRKAMCLRELAVNRIMAPELYEEVRAVVRRGASLAFGAPDDPDAIDYVVVMRRFAQADLLEQRRKRGELSLAEMDELADAIADFHDRAEVDHSHGGVDGIRAVVVENIALLREGFADTPLAEKAERYAALSEDRLVRSRALLGWRRKMGLVRRCHGDLHLNNVCRIGGRPVLFDAIEFDESFACIDVFYDLAFMLMDLDWHGLRGHANRLLNRYLQATGDVDGLALLPLFLSCRAAIRSHVAIANRKVSGHDVADARDPARLLELAIAYLEPPAPRLVAIGGLSGTGKSTLARALAPGIGASPGAVVLRSDVIRKALMKVGETVRLGEEAYTPEVSARVFAKINEKAARILRSGHSVVADAVFGEPAQRNAVAAVARAAGAGFRGLWLSAPRAVLEQRISARKADASDATLAVLASQMSHIAEPADWTRVSAEGPPETLVPRAEAALAATT
jgi:uncharacterized protein